VIALVIFAVIIQAAAAVMAVRLIRLTGRRLAWGLISTALFLMAARRAIPLYHWLAGDPRLQLDAATELIGLAVSVLMAAGVFGLGPVFRTITKADEVHRQDQATLTSVLDSIPQSVYWKDVNSVYLGCNPVTARAAGLGSPAEIVGKTDVDLPWRDYAESFRADDCEVIEKGRPLRRVVTLAVQPGGRQIWVRTVKVPLTDASGQACGILGIAEDITERNRAEEALRESEERYRSIFEQAPIGIFQSTLEGRLLRVNPALARMFRYDSPEKMVSAGTDIGSRFFVHPELRSAIVQEVQRSQAFVEREVEYWRSDGTVVTAILQMRAVRGEGGEPDFLEGFAEDITERKRAENELRSSEARFRSYFELPLFGIAMSSLEKRWLQVNDRLCAILGYSRDELTQITWP
jgi:PAS domain S-box-containing protein